MARNENAEGEISKLQSRKTHGGVPERVACDRFYTRAHCSSAQCLITLVQGNINGLHN